MHTKRGTTHLRTSHDVIDKCDYWDRTEETTETVNSRGEGGESASIYRCRGVLVGGALLHHVRAAQRVTACDPSRCVQGVNVQQQTEAVVPVSGRASKRSLPKTPSRQTPSPCPHVPTVPRLQKRVNHLHMAKRQFHGLPHTRAHHRLACRPTHPL